MKKNAIVFIAAVTLLITSCSKDKKEDASPTPSPVIGFWQGNYTTTGQLGSSNYAMLIKAGGVARVYEMDTKTDTSQLSALQKVDATWTLTGNSLQTTYKTGTKTVATSTTLNDALNKMTGTWAFDGVTKGNITLNK